VESIHAPDLRIRFFFVKGYHKNLSFKILNNIA
jgi:hypothetical protein